MKVTKVREHTEDELKQLLADTRKELFELRGKRTKGESSVQPLRMRLLRRDIARIVTVIRERGARG